MLAYSLEFNLNSFCYNLKTREVMNYLWTETAGGLSASVFTSIHTDYLSKCLEENPEIREIIVWSDGCVYQNKNAVKVSALRRLAARFQVYIIFKYLQVGHTFMECDSVHRCIENSLKKKDINIPEDYLSVIKHARTNPSPYKVRFNKLLPYTFFKDFEAVHDVPTIRPGCKTNDPTVNDIKQLKFTQDGTIYYKLAHNEEQFRILPVMRRLAAPNTHPILNQLYTEPRPLTAQKYKYLQELAETVPEFFRLYYDRLPKKPSIDDTATANHGADEGRRGRGLKRLQGGVGGVNVKRSKVAVSSDAADVVAVNSDADFGRGKRSKRVNRVQKGVGSVSMKRSKVAVISDETDVVGLNSDADFGRGKRGRAMKQVQ